MSRLLALALVACVIGVQLVAVARNYRWLARDYRASGPVIGSSDFAAFYAGAKLMLSSERSRSYDEETQGRTVLAVKGEGDDLSRDSGWYRYYNPPAYSLLIAPLALLTSRQAYLVSVAVNLTALLALMLLMGTILRWQQPLTIFMLAGLAASEPLYYGFWHAQPNILLALIVGSAFYIAERGHDAWSGAILALAGIKPQLLTFTSIALIRRRPKALMPLSAVFAATLLPFALLGFHGTLDYVRLVRSRGHGDLYDDGFAEALLSWSGFFRAYAGSVQPHAWLAFSLLTAFAFLRALIAGRQDPLPLAAVITTLLIGPHSHPQDWLLIAPAACFLVRDQVGPRLWISASLLLVVLLGLAGWHGLSESDRAIYWPTLAAFVLLLWLAALSADLDRRAGLTLSRVGSRLSRGPATPAGHSPRQSDRPQTADSSAAKHRLC